MIYPIFQVVESSPIDILAKYAELIIAAGSVFSIWLSIKALNRSDWNASMATVPSLTLEPRINLWEGDSDRLYSGGGGPVVEVRSSNRFSIIRLDFLLKNEGRGIALNIKAPEIVCSTGSFAISQYSQIPLSKGIISDPDRIEVEIRVPYTLFFENKGEGFDFKILINYTNDQGNISCRTIWSSEIKPFDFSEINQKLIANQTMLIKPNMKVTYGTKK